MTVDELKKLFCVDTDEKLGAHFDRKGGAVSAWRKKGLPPSIELKANKLLSDRNVGLSGNTLDGTARRDLLKVMHNKLEHMTDKQLNGIMIQILVAEGVKEGSEAEG